MTTGPHQRSAHARTGQSASRVVVVSAVFVAVLATAWVIGRDFVVSGTPVSSDMYRGLVQLAPDEQGRCDQFEYNNKTGWIRPKGSMRCNEMTTALPSRSSDSLRRLYGISDYFKSR